MRKQRKRQYADFYYYFDQLPPPVRIALNERAQKPTLEEVYELVKAQKGGGSAPSIKPATKETRAAVNAD